MDHASKDISNAAFWRKLASISAETHEMISAWAKENGVDLSPSALAPVVEQNERRRSTARKNRLARDAEEYAYAVSQWFD